MSEEGGHGSFLLWERQPWTAALSNSDNNNSSAGTGSEDKSAGKTNHHHQQPLQDSTKTKTNKRGADSDHEMHIWTERERRRKMRNMFSGLHDLLPQLPPKADKSTIVDEAVNYIKTLEKTLQKLQKQKLDRLQACIDLGCHHEQPPTATTPAALGSSSREAFMADRVNATDKFSNPNTLSVSQSALQFQTWSSPNVVLNICGTEAQISVCSPKKPGLFTTLCCILEKHKVEVVSAHVSSDSNRCMFMIQARVASTAASNHQQAGAFQVDEIFKQAAAEFMCWVTS
ncbi:RETARDED GROWTH OF EMBRYO 1, ZHOUPI [Hibiscus trionum]|uniref:RETARDED GROWTH OF EMBRYO 1, ZHOUPI n=1 Tax=Hibiscus trionum TaxID=183268 RepID=A0A9W7HV55_HIBTR|nr:RETARDED GROWTH OF EMBRYO 1, ZHOUPI [Hibiscus trionum]